MSGKLQDEFRQHEAEALAFAVKLNRWSLVMVQLMIDEQEKKLVASDLPVEAEEDNPFWTGEL